MMYDKRKMMNDKGASAPDFFSFVFSDFVEEVFSGISERVGGIPPEAEVPGKQAIHDLAAQYGEPRVEKVLTWLFLDDTETTLFWRRQIRRPEDLLKVCKDGRTKFDRILADSGVST